MAGRVAVIGTGIAGMGAGYFLRDDREVVFYEQDIRPGGHTHTVRVREAGADVFVDTGFIVFNEATYPNLTRLFGELKVEVRDTCMSFSVTDVPENLFYKATGLDNLFVQRRNLLSAGFWRMLLEVTAFQRLFPKILSESRWEERSLGDLVREQGFSRRFTDHFLVPMAAALWSCPKTEVMRFPAVTLVRFFHNHRFLGLTGQHPWKTVSGGSRMYRDRLLAFFPGRVRLGCGAVRVERSGGGAYVLDTAGKKEFYDQVVIAAHADQALAMLADPTPQERRLLGAFAYQPNHAALHSDPSVMPPQRRAWAAWNYFVDGRRSGVISYDMNILQNVSRSGDYLVSLNDGGAVDRKMVFWEGDYEHPLFDSRAYQAQKSLAELNAGGPVFYCGSYFRYGFHEDALTSALEAVRAMLGRLPEGYRGFGA